MSIENFNLFQIGKVIVKNGDFFIQIDLAYRAALKGLEGFSHVNVLWWSHYLQAPEMRQQTVLKHPYKHGPIELGVFATRSPMRPNPICLSVAAVIHMDEPSGVIQLAYIDAQENTPVLDIKPYLPCCDRLREAATPAWNRHWPDCIEDSAVFDWEAEFDNAR